MRGVMATTRALGAAALLGTLGLGTGLVLAKDCTVPRLVENPVEGDVELTDEEANAVYACLLPEMIEAYARAAVAGAAGWADDHAFSTRPYSSAAHGNRQIMTYGNEASVEAYGQYEDGPEMPAGAHFATSSFEVAGDGRAALGPLYLMQKMGADFDAPGAWQYALVTPNGSILGVTNGEGGDKIGFCNACHQIVAEDQDYLYFPPEDTRIATD